MDPDFWHEKWHNNEIGFHNSEIHPLLLRYWPSLGLAPDARVLVPLAGKTLDLRWLLEQGHSVTAVELSQLAVEIFFEEQGWTAQTSEQGDHTVFQHGELTFRAGDFFSLPEKDEAPYDAVYDRAALIALPPEMRQRYVDTLAKLLKPGGSCLLISLEYPRNALQGPPFVVDGGAVHALFEDHFSIRCLGRHPSDAKGVAAFETVYTLERL